MHVSNWSNNDWHTGVKWGYKKGQKTEIKTPWQQDGRYRKWKPMKQPACDVRLSLTAMQASSAQGALGPVSHAWETRTRKWTWAVGRWASGCPTGKGPLLLATCSCGGPSTLAPQAPQLTFVLKITSPRPRDKLQDKKQIFKWGAMENSGRLCPILTIPWMYLSNGCKFPPCWNFQVLEETAMHMDTCFFKITEK